MTETTPALSDGPTLSRRLAAPALFLFWAVAITIASWFPDSRIWGANHLAFVSDSVRWGFYVSVVFFSISLIWRIPFLVGFPRLRMQGREWIGPTALATGVAIVGWLLRSRAPLLGDGFMRAADAASGSRILPSEFLPSLLSHFLASGLPMSIRLGGQDAIRVVSIAAGVMLVFGLWWLTPKTNSQGSRGIMLWILTFGTARLFAGYVESYALPVAFTLLWTLALIAYRRGGVGIIPVVVFSLLAVLSHATAVLLIPATLWVLWESNGSGRRWRNLAAYTLVMLATVALLADRIHADQVGAIGLGITDFLLPLTGHDPHMYGVLSPAHLVDCLNQLILLMPALVMGLPLMVLRRPREIGEPAVSQTRDRVFWLLAAGLPILAGMLLDPKLGWARDWDLYCVMFAPAMVGGAVILTRFESVPQRAARFGVAILSVALWLSFSADADSEVQRFESLLNVDRSRSDYGHEILALYYRDTGRPMAEIMQYKEALEITDNPRYHVSLGNAFSNLGRPEEAATWYRSATERDPSFHEAHFGLSVTLNSLGRTEEALQHARRAVILKPDNPEYQYHLGYLLMRKSAFAEALPHMVRGATTEPPSARNLNSLGVCYTELGRLPDGLSTLERAMQIEPNYAPSYLNAARISLMRANTTEVRRLLDLYDGLVPKDQRVPLADMIADSLAKLANPPSD